MNLSGTLDAIRDSARKDAIGVGASLFLHALALLLLAYLAQRSFPEPSRPERFIPVSLVAQSEGASPQPRQQRAAGIVSQTPLTLPRAPRAQRTPTAVAPVRTENPADELEMQLKSLSKLRQPNTDTRLLGDAGKAYTSQQGNDETSGGEGAYTSRDIIRAQILRRWSLDMARLGNRNFDILIHVLLKPDGTVLEADIVDSNRYKSDSVFRWIALSARNAVILSSPLTLPSGVGGRNLDLTLKLNPRDTMR